MMKFSRTLVLSALAVLGVTYAIARECAGGTRIYKVTTTGGTSSGVTYYLCNDPGDCVEITGTYAAKLGCAY